MTISVNIHEAKARLSHLIELALKGEEVRICRRNVPLIEFKRLESKPQKPRPFGMFKGQVKILPGFFDPMDPEELALWEGEGPLYHTAADVPPALRRKKKKSEIPDS